jgi:hypothetical protein
MLAEQLTLQNGFSAFVLVCSLLALRNWRLGVGLGIVVGLIQDPIRKSIPGTPGLLAVAAAPVLCATVVSALASGDVSLRRFREAYPRIAGWAFLFLLSLIPATLVLLQQGGSLYRLGLFGLYGWLTPLAAALLGVFWVRRPGDLSRLTIFYCAVAGLFLTGTLLEYQGRYPEWPALGTWSLDANWDRQAEGVDIGLTSGFFRSPDLMSWHAATLTVLALMLAQSEHRPRTLGWLVLAGYGATCLLLGGRRKMIGIPFLWGALAFLPLVGSGRLARAVGLLSAAALAGLVLLLASDEIGVIRDYFVFAGSTADDAPSRFGDSLRSVARMWRVGGWTGLGVGSASVGAQHLGLRVPTAPEDGLGKLMAELGVPGLVLGLALAAVVASTLMGQLRVVARTPWAPTHYGLAALASANVVPFLVSHHAYGDSLVMFMSGMILGLALSVPHWPHRFEAYRRART